MFVPLVHTNDCIIICMLKKCGQPFVLNHIAFGYLWVDIMVSKITEWRGHAPLHMHSRLVMCHC
jgi:hypothetical protein